MSTSEMFHDAMDQLDDDDIGNGHEHNTHHEQQQQQHPNREFDDDFEAFQTVPESKMVKETELNAGMAMTNNPTSNLHHDTSVVLQSSSLTSHQPRDVSCGNSNTTATNTNTSTSSNATGCTRFVSPKDFELLKVIGMGAFGKVLQVRNRQTQQVLAMKIISKRLLRKKGESIIENIQAERNIMMRIRHPFVVSMHCSFQSREKLFIIMDFLAGGELFLRLGKEGIFLEKTVRFWLMLWTKE